MTDDSIENFFLKFYFHVLVPLKFEFGYDIYIIRKPMKNSIALGSYMLKKSIFKKKKFCLSMALSKVQKIFTDFRQVQDFKSTTYYRK